MGKMLGLPRQALADLGVAGLLHDIGKLTVPADVLQKPAALTPEEWDLMRRHPIEGFKMMTHMPGFSPLILDAMRVCLEHHMNFDRTGYPEFKLEWGQSVPSGLVAVADCFDAIIARRPSRAGKPASQAWTLPVSNCSGRAPRGSAAQSSQSPRSSSSYQRPWIQYRSPTQRPLSTSITCTTRGWQL